MRLLIDECIPRKFKASLTTHGHKCLTVPEAGFAGKKNGELLSAAEGHFDVFITLDRGIQYQQNIKGRRIGLIIIRAKSNRLADVRPHAPECLVALQTIASGEVVQIG